MNISRYELLNKIPPREVKTLRVLYTGLAGIVILMSAVFLYFYDIRSTDTVAQPDDQLNSPILLISLLVIAALEYSLIYFIPKLQLSPDKLKARLSTVMQNQQGEHMAEHVFVLFQIYRTIMILRLAMLDSVAFLGLFILFYSVLNKMIYFYPIYWIALIPSVILFFFVYIYFPTKEKIVFYIEKNMLEKLRNIA